MIRPSPDPAGRVTMLGLENSLRDGPFVCIGAA